MAWQTIRPATKEDYEKLQKRAQAFAERHGLDTLYPCPNPITPLGVEEMVFDVHYRYGQPQLKHYWRRIVQRALGKGAEGIAYGYVGYHVQ